jgi:hypothetical protein
MVVDNFENGWDVDEETYLRLVKQWKNNPKFFELNRHIYKNYGLFNSCGKDGDCYVTSWNGDPYTAEPAVTMHSYVNKVQASRSVFSYPKISKEEARAKGLYEYPEFYDRYKQLAILGLDSVDLPNEVEGERMMEYVNGAQGPSDKVKVFVLLFPGKSPLIAKDQEAYWVGGNKNELVICIGLKEGTSEITWVQPFSWTENRRVVIDAREDIASTKNLDLASLWKIVSNVVKDNFKYKEFEEFNYLTIDTPAWSSWVGILLAIFSSVGFTLWAVRNEHESSIPFTSKLFWEKLFKRKNF